MTQTAAAEAPATADAKPDWQITFEKAYALKPGENLKYIAPGRVPERQTYMSEIEHDTHQLPVPFIQWRWTDGKLKRGMISAAGPNGVQLAAVLSCCANLDSHQITTEGVGPINADGDWIVRDGAKAGDILLDLQKILRDDFQINVQIDKKEEIIDALVITGEYKFDRLAEVKSEELQVYAEFLDHPKPGQKIKGGGRTEPAYLWKILGEALGMPLVDEATKEPAKINWLLSWSIEGADKDANKREVILRNISEQTGLTFKEEKRTRTVWKLTPAAK